MSPKEETTLLQKMRNQIIGLSIAALGTGLGLNILFINSINLRFSLMEKNFDRIEKKIDIIQNTK